MRIGPLRHLSTIEELAQGKDTAGGIVKTWGNFAKRWASVRPIRGTERWYSKEKHSTATHEIIMRFAAGIDTKMRIQARGRIFDIVDIQNPDERDKMLRIIATEEADNDR